MTPAEVQDLMLAFNKAVIERAMGAEMNLHLGYAAGQSKPAGLANERNGASARRSSLIAARSGLRYRATATVASNRS
jgi:transposase-like protein